MNEIREELEELKRRVKGLEITLSIISLTVLIGICADYYHRAQIQEYHRKIVNAWSELIDSTIGTQSEYHSETSELQESQSE